jgi:hypothetical protein
VGNPGDPGVAWYGNNVATGHELNHAVPPAILKTESWIALICDHIYLSGICDVVLTWQRKFLRPGSVCGPDAGRKKWRAVRGLKDCKRFQKKENAGKVPGSNSAVNVSLTLAVPNFADAGYRAADIPRLRVCYTPLCLI